MTALERARGVLRARGLAVALPLHLVAMLLWPVAAAAIPPLPGGGPPPIPVPNPFVPGLGPNQGLAVSGCNFSALGPAEVRTLFREAPGASFGIDPSNPCHVYRAVNQQGVYRSDASGRGFNLSFKDQSQQATIHNGPFSFGPVATSGGGGGPTYIYDASGSNGVVYSPDNGASWNQAINGLYSGGSGPTGGITAFAVAPGNAAVAYLAGSVAGQSDVFVTTDSGQNWRLAGPIQYPITSLSVDPANPGHVVAAAGGPTTPVGRSGLDEFYDSPNYGSGWNPMAGPPGQASPITVTIGGGQRVYAVTGSLGSGAQDITQVTGQKFWRLTPGRAWDALTVPSSLGKDSVIAYNPANTNEMMVASAAGLGIAFAGSLDGFNTTRYSKVIRTDQQVQSVQLRADRYGQFFALARGSSEDQLLALRVTALAPDPPPPGVTPANLQTALKVCNLFDLSKPGPLPGTRTKVNYFSGSIAFDGRFLDYTHDDQGPPGAIYRIDPSNCQEQATIQPSVAEFGGTKALPLFSLTFDPRYVFNNGHTGAILARGGTGAYHDERVQNQNDVAIYAVDPSPNPAPMEIAASAPCGTSYQFVCDQGDPNIFNYDHYLDALWIPIPGDYDVPLKGLARLPTRKGPNNRIVPVPTCMTNWVPPDPGNTDMAMWEPGADGILYVAMENPNDTIVLRVNSRTCQYLDAFTHETYSEGPSGFNSHENDQMACDAITFGQGAPNVPNGTGTSVLWIRDNALNLVRAYPIAHGFCPFPTTLELLNPPVTAHAGDTVTLCATLQASTAGTPKPISGQSVQFTLGGTGLGTGVTNAEGRACITTAVPNVNGTLKLVVSYAGTEAYLPASVLHALRVTPNPPPPANQPASHAFPPAHVAPPQPAIVPAPPAPIPATQVQAQAQAQAQVQAQAQAQPGVMTEKQKQARVNLARIDGGKQMADIEASRYHAALFAQGSGLAMFGIGLWVRHRRNRRRRPMQARNDARGPGRR